MNNSVLIYYDDVPFVVLLTRSDEVRTTEQIVSDYVKWGGFSLNRMKGTRMSVLNLDKTTDGFAYKPFSDKP